MSTTAPDIHIAVMGIEKVIARLDQLPPLLTLLTRSATGQAITTYVNMITGPRRAGERDGPHQVHLVLLDNGRSRIDRDPELRTTLRCIRCGACMNHCPVYIRIGGHGYGTVYPGPIGAILEPQLQGLDACGALPEASTLCGACAEVCPVRIPIPRLLNRLRHERAEGRAVPGSRRPGRQAWIWQAWAFVHRTPARYRWLRQFGIRLLRPFNDQLPLGAWSRSRCAPRIAAVGLHRLARDAGFVGAATDRTRAQR
jgi:L-lactate dehydrogenase complex protein LldF